MLMTHKFEQLKEIIGNNLVILTIVETKLDSSFPDDQYLIDGYCKPFRLDRNKHGGGVKVFVREDIPSKIVTKHKFKKNIEGMFIQINLGKKSFITCNVSLYTS